jgi:hypothetical protein
MVVERWKRLEDLLQSALRLPTDHRDEFLRQAFAEDIPRYRRSDHCCRLIAKPAGIRGLGPVIELHPIVSVCSATSIELGFREGLFPVYLLLAA